MEETIYTYTDRNYPFKLQEIKIKGSWEEFLNKRIKNRNSNKKVSTNRTQQSYRGKEAITILDSV